MSRSQFSRLPEELLQSILLNMDYDNIKKSCSVSNYFFNICQLDNLWRAKFIHDYGFNLSTTTGLTQSLENIFKSK